MGTPESAGIGSEKKPPRSRTHERRSVFRQRIATRQRTGNTQTMMRLIQRRLPQRHPALATVLPLAKALPTKALFARALLASVLLTSVSVADTRLNDSEGLGGTGLRPAGEEEGIGGTGRSLERPELPERPELMQRPDFEAGADGYDSGVETGSDSVDSSAGDAPDQPDTDVSN